MPGCDTLSILGAVEVVDPFKFCRFEKGLNKKNIWKIKKLSIKLQKWGQL